jgi:hypothetical protein
MSNQKKVVLTEQVAIEFLASLGIEVVKKAVPYKPTKLEYLPENQQAFKDHFAKGRTVRLNFGLYKKRWIVECFSTFEEMRTWLIANPYRIKHIKSVSLL